MKTEIPKWIEQRVYALYEECIQDVERHRPKQGNAYHMALGEVVAMEALMDRLLMEYTDQGRVSELYL